MRKQYQVITLDSRVLENSEFFQLLSETKEAISATIKSNKQDAAIYTNRVAILTELLPKLEASLHLSKKSKVTGVLETADRERDDALSTFTQLVRAFARVKDPETKAAYDILARLLSNYSALAQQSYEKETEGINHLLNQLKESKYQSALTRLHLTVHVETLKTAQKNFENRYKERLSEQSTQTPSQIRELRRQLQEHYDFLIDFTAVNAYAYPEKTLYATLRSNLNSIRERYKKLQPPKKSKKAVPDTTEVPPAEQ
ncbi:MAG: DUF6261 family protein [Aerococcaceae bacterium]|nr:DUF6261 family protein [Aerococcaceae bacterium]